MRAAGTFVKRAAAYLLAAAALLFVAELAFASPETEILGGAASVARDGCSVMAYDAENQTAKGYFRALLLNRYWMEYEMEVSGAEMPAMTACDGLYDISLHTYDPAAGRVEVKWDRNSFAWLRVWLFVIWIEVGGCWLVQFCKEKFRAAKAAGK